jgi:hypothetical protein
MKNEKMLPPMFILILVSLVLVACKTPQVVSTQIPPTNPPTHVPPTATSVPPINTPSQSPSTTTPMPTLSPLLIEVTFDDSNCTVSGPTELPIGDHQFVLNNLTETYKQIWMNIILDENKTIDDMLLHPVGYGGVLPQWRLSDGREVFTCRLDREAEYEISVGSFQPLERWICSSVYISDSP